MPEIRPFRALRYDPDVVGDLAKVVAPPYDVIDAAQQDALYARSPFNAVRLVLGREADRYAAAAEALVGWQGQRALVRDRDPSLYLYVQDFVLPGGDRRQRSGIIGIVRLEPFSSGRIRPHERTLSVAKADRMRLFQACKANLSPIFGIYPGGTEALDAARDRAGRETALVDLQDDAGVRHRLWRVSQEDLIAGIRRDLEPRTVLIADGHHRYETALAYRDFLAQTAPLAADDPANFVMMFLCSTADPGMVILPTHRVLRGLAHFDAEAFLARMRESFCLRAFDATRMGRGALLDALGNSSGGGCMGVAVRGAIYLASLRDVAILDREAADLAPAVRHLDVTVLDRLVLRPVLEAEPAVAAQDGRLQYVKDAEQSFDKVAAGNADAAFVLRATRMDEIEAACEAGETMPEKSTYFYPKLLTGLVFHSLRDLLHPETPGVGS